VASCSITVFEWETRGKVRVLNRWTGKSDLGGDVQIPGGVDETLAGVGLIIEKEGRGGVSSLGGKGWGTGGRAVVAPGGRRGSVRGSAKVATGLLKRVSCHREDVPL